MRGNAKGGGRPVWGGLVVAAVAACAGAAGLAVAATADPEAARRQNPVPMSESSLAAGQTVYNKNCRACHGRDGSGGGAGPSLVDETWDHGSTDGEIYTVIRLGASGTRMEPWDDRVSETETWHLVNYIRSLKTAGK